MLKDMFADIVKDLLKFVVGFAVPVSLVFIGAALFGIGIKLESVILISVGAIVVLVGVIWGLFLFLWHGGV